MTSSNAPQPIEKIRHSMYVHAERWWWGALASVVTGVAASTLLTRPFLASGGMLESLVLIVSALAPVVAAVARYRSGIFAARGDLCRRAFLYQNALGEELSIEEQRIVALWPDNTPLNRITTQRPYFSTQEGKGPGRLVQAVGESAFYTAQLARAMAVAGYILSGASVIMLLVGLSAITTLDLDPGEMGRLQTTIGLTAIVVLTLITAEILVTAIAYGSLSREAQEIARSSSQFNALAEKSEVTAVRLAESYSIALAVNLPIPDLVYRWHHDRIDRAYRNGLALHKDAQE